VAGDEGITDGFDLDDVLVDFVNDSEVALDELLGQLADEWTLQKTLTSTNCELALYEPAFNAGVPLVIKQCPGWTADHVRGLSLTLEACRLHAEVAGIDSFVAASRSWGEDPVYLSTDWVDGTDMRHWFAATFADLPLDDAVGRSMEACARVAGLMAHYHQAMADFDLADSGVPQKSATVEESGSAVRLIRILRGRPGVDRSERVRSIDDPGPHNTVVGHNGELWLIDLPAHLQVVMLERDIARLASRLVGAVQKHSNSVWVPRMRHYRGVVDAVVDGYEKVGSPRERSIDLSLVYACLTLDAMLKVAHTRVRRAPGRRLEPFVRESLAVVGLTARTLWLRVRLLARRTGSR